MKRMLMIFIAVSFFSKLMSQEKAIEQVSQATDRLRIAMEKADVPALNELVVKELSYGHSSGVIENKEQFISKLAGGQSDFVSITLSQQTIAIKGKTAIVRHRLDATTNDNGKPGEVHLYILLVWQKTGKQWKLLARQAVKVV